LRRACIDIGSNTTRLLVAECDPERLLEVHQQRAFTRIGAAVRADGRISAEKLTEVARVVAEQLQSARDLGALDVRAVATASIRSARNGDELVAAIARECGLEVRILSEAEEARLAFVGAARTLGHAPSGELGVVDVGGGSSELAVGTAPDQVRWSVSFPVGSGLLADRCLVSDPPSRDELDHARAEVRDALAGVHVPRPAEAVAVGGSAASLRRIAGDRLDAAAFGRALALLASEPATELARRFALDRERIRLLPAGLVILEGVAEVFGSALDVGSGGIREALLLEAARNGA
jgi:exopolyphosphatase / guanosine-5'-triphosphate,3'-diphosphate pyrophosphatase